MADIPQVVSTEPAQKVPGLMDLASSAVDPIAEASKAVDLAKSRLPSEYEIREAEQQAALARDAYRKMPGDYKAAIAPMEDAYRLAADKYSADAQSKLPKPAQIPDQPGLGLKPFLASTANEPVEATLGKFIQSMSLLATMIGGGRQGARASMSALTGAMEGWRDGAKYQADRQYKAWQDQTEALFRQFDQEMRAYNSVMTAERVPLDQKFAALELRAREYRNDLLAGDLAVREADKVNEALDRRVKAVAQAQEHFAKLVQSKQKGDAEIQLRRENAAKSLEVRKSALEMHRQMALVPTMAPQDIQTLAENYLSSGGQKAPTFGLGHNADRNLFWSEVARLTPQYGGAEGLAARSAGIRGLQNELSQVMAIRGKAEGFSETANKNAKMAVELSNAVDRTGSPMLDQWLLAGRKRWSGDPEVAKFDAATRSVINEITRVLNSATTAGVVSDTARKEIEASLSIALSPEQFVGVVEMYAREMKNRSDAYADDIRRISLDIKKMAGAMSRGESPGAPGAQVPQATPGEKPTGKSRTITVNGKQVTVTEE